MGFPGGSVGKETQCSRLKRHVFDPWIGKIPLIYSLVYCKYELMDVFI